MTVSSTMHERMKKIYLDWLTNCTNQKMESTLKIVVQNMSYPLDSTSAAGSALPPDEIRAPSLDSYNGAARTILGANCDDGLASFAALALPRDFDLLEAISVREEQSTLV